MQLCRKSIRLQSRARFRCSCQAITNASLQMRCLQILFPYPGHIFGPSLRMHQSPSSRSQLAQLASPILPNYHYEKHSRRQPFKQNQSLMDGHEGVLHARESKRCRPRPLGCRPSSSECNKIATTISIMQHDRNWRAQAAISYIRIVEEPLVR